MTAQKPLPILDSGSRKRVSRLSNSISAAMRISLGLAGITLGSVIGAFYMVGIPANDFLPWSTMQFAILVASFSCLISYAYLRTIIGDSTPGKTIPPHVRATLDSLPQGLVVVNPDHQLSLIHI